MTDLLNVGERELRDILSRGSAWKLRDEIVRQARAAWERELAEVKRQAAWDALTAYALVQDAYRTVEHYRDTHYVPTPRSVTLSDGSVVEFDGTHWMRDKCRYSAGGIRGEHWFGMLAETDTGADFEKLKAFAATVEKK